MRIPATPVGYIQPSYGSMPPYQLLQNDYMTQEVRQRNHSTSTEPLLTPLNSPAESFGVGSIVTFYIFSLFQQFYFIFRPISLILNSPN